MGLHVEQLNELPEYACKVLSKLSLIIFTAASNIFGQDENSAWRLKTLVKKWCGSGQVHNLFVMDVVDLHGAENMNIICICSKSQEYHEKYKFHEIKFIFQQLCDSINLI